MAGPGLLLRGGRRRNPSDSRPRRERPLSDRPLIRRHLSPLPSRRPYRPQGNRRAGCPAARHGRGRRHHGPGHGHVRPQDALGRERHHPDERRAQWLREAHLKPFTDRTVTSAAPLASVLEQVAHDGFALVDQELEEGLRSVAVPLLGRDGRVIAAANVSLQAGRTSADEARETVLPALRAAARRISADAALISEVHLLPFV
ncbi:IclR family transcriptional regulator C-terminal domain-containing protein [Streptomyces sp. NPDC056730]|uniref:IclR family transcriptional regulator domain-containing protein n=1 Tax=unclassified Streptomyces TaxID=2593676 RepID=UPI0036D0A4F6